MSVRKAAVQAAEWTALKADSDRAARLEQHFADVNPEQLVEMWETHRTPDGRKLTSFEFAALCERWCVVFGELPPDDGTEGQNEIVEDGDDRDANLTDANQLDDDRMLKSKEVVSLTGLSLSTIKRLIKDGYFPRPTRLSPRRNGWNASKVKAWLRDFEEQSSKTRH